jgi:predicted SnoaL-like aldol condensation-catalyzing enzyme
MTQSTPREPLDLVLEYHRAWTKGDVDRAIKLVSEDFVCQAPTGALGREEMRKYLAGFVPRLTGIVDIAQFCDDAHVVLIYYPQTAVTQTTPAAEYFTIRDGLIAESLLMFDRLAYAPPKDV